MALGYAPRLTKPATISFGDKIRIKLTDLGRQVHRDWHTELFADARHGVVGTYTPPPVGEDGCCEFFLWEVASIFGRKLYVGCQPPFEFSAVVVPNRPYPDQARRVSIS